MTYTEFKKQAAEAPANGPYIMSDRSPEDQANVLAAEGARKYPNIPKSHINLAGLPNGKGVAHPNATERYARTAPRERFFAHNGKSKTPYFDARYTAAWRHMGESDDLAGEIASIFDKSLPKQEYMTTENYTDADVAKARANQAQILASQVVPPTDPRFGNVVKYLIHAGEVNSDWFDKYKTLPGTPWFKENVPEELRMSNPYGPDPEGINQHEINDWHLLHDKLYRLRHSIGDTYNPAASVKTASYIAIQALRKQAAESAPNSRAHENAKAPEKKPLSLRERIKNNIKAMKAQWAGMDKKQRALCILASMSSPMAAAQMLGQQTQLMQQNNQNALMAHELALDAHNQAIADHMTAMGFM